MSKISLEPNASGAGTFTLAAPNSNTNRTLTLPDESGTVATTENIPPGYEDQDALDLFNVSGSAPVYACRAWVNFDGTGTVSIRNSGNVSSITDNGTGDYTVNFATAMEDANYAVGHMALGSATQGTSVSFRATAPLAGSFRVSVVQVSVTAGSNFSIDREFVTMAIFR